MKRKIFSILMCVIMAIAMLPAAAYAQGTAEVPASEAQICTVSEAPACLASEGSLAVYVSASGSDDTGGGTQESPYATLAKAVNAAPDGATIYVMSDLTVTSCARFYDKHLTITGAEESDAAGSKGGSSAGGAKSAVTLTRGRDFSTQQDNARSTYNPAMIEVQGTGTSAGSGTGAGSSSGSGSGSGASSVGLTLSNIIIDDNGAHEGSVFAQAISGEGKTDNTVYVQDAIIVSNATVPCTITLGEGAVLRNFGGMSAMRATDQAQIIMKSGSLIEDTLEGFTRAKGKAADEVGPAGAIWLQGGTFIMENGAKIQNVNGRAVYAESGKVNIGGTISGIVGNNKAMWQGDAGTAVHLRNKAVGTLTSAAVIENISGGGSAVYSNGSDLTAENGSILRNIEKTTGIAVTGTCEVSLDGEITGLTGSSNAVNLQKGEFHVTIGKNGYIHDNHVGYGTVYIQATNGKLDIYGKINNNIASDRGGGIAMANNYKYPTIVTMYDGAEICGNYSNQTGGGIMVSVGDFTMKGGTISNNSAKQMGGGVYVRRGGSFIMEGGTVSDNTTAEYGGGIAYEAGEYNGGIPCVKLNGGTVKDNIMSAAIDTITENSYIKEVNVSGGTSNDLSVLNKGDVFSHVNRYFYISDEANIANSAVYFQTDNKTITPDDYCLDIKLGNASPDKKTSTGSITGSTTALKNFAASKGWSAPLATFWAQCGGAARLTASGLNLKQDASGKTLPVYILVQKTNAEGYPDTASGASGDSGAAGGSSGAAGGSSGTSGDSSDAAVNIYASRITDDGVEFYISPSALAGNGCAIALVQPTTDYGTLTVESPDTLHENDDDDPYIVPHCFTYILSDSMESIIMQAAQDKKSVTYSLDVDTDDRLFGSHDEFKGEFDINKKTIDVDYTLKNDHFEAGDNLFTSAVLTISVGDDAYIIPSNVTETKMVGLLDIVFDYNDDSGKTQTVSVVPGESLGDSMPADPARSGYTFAGWNTAKDGTGSTFNKNTAVSESATVYACWTENRKDKGDQGDNDGQDGQIIIPPDLNSIDHIAYVCGYTDGTVKPNNKITRAETATMLFRLLTKTRRSEIQTFSNSFSDVSGSDWYNEAVSTMTNGKYITGYPDGTFGGNKSITRAEFIAMLVRFIGTKDAGCSFSDIPEDYWAYDYIATATQAGWISGYTDGSFKPGQAITRAEAMTVINRTLNRGVDESSRLPSFKAWPDNDPSAWYYYEVIEATNRHLYTGSRPSENWLSVNFSN